MATTRPDVFTAVRLLVLSSVILVSSAAAAQAATLTVFFGGTMDLSGAGGPANSTYSGFFTWNPLTAPFQSDTNERLYFTDSYQLVLNGVNRTLGPGNGAVVIGNNADLNGGPGSNDYLVFLAALDNNVTINGVTGDTLFVLGFTANQNFWNTLALPSDYGFLAMPNRFSGVSLEVSGGEDVMVGQGGTFAASPVPEPATLTLTALGLAGVLARGRRASKQRNQ